MLAVPVRSGPASQAISNAPQPASLPSRDNFAWGVRQVPEHPFPPVTPPTPTPKPAMETIETVENNKARFPRVPTVFHSPYD